VGDTSSTWEAITTGTLGGTPTTTLAGDGPFARDTATFTFTNVVPLKKTDYLSLQFHTATTDLGSTKCTGYQTATPAKTFGLDCSQDGTNMVLKCILQVDELELNDKTVECTGFANPAATVAAVDHKIQILATGDQLLQESADLTLAAIVAPTITAASMTLSNPAAAELATSTFTFTIPAASADLQAADTMGIVVAHSATVNVGDLNCHSATLGLTSCSYTAAGTFITCTISDTVMGDFGTELPADLTPGIKVVTCEGITNAAAGAADTDDNNIVFARVTDEITISAANFFTRPQIEVAITGDTTMTLDSYVPGALTTATIVFDPTVNVADGDKWVVEFPAGTTFDDAMVGAAKGAAVSGTCNTQATSGVDFSACAFDTATAKLTCTTDENVANPGAQTLTCEEAVYAPPVLGVTSHLSLVIQTTATTTTQEQATLTMTKTGTYLKGDHTRDRVVCVGGGAIPPPTADTGSIPGFSGASFVVLNGRSPVCLSQSNREIKTPTLAKNHAGHRFIEWDGKICAAGGGSFEYFKTTGGSDVDKDIECWDKNPNHGWVLQSMPSGTDAGGDLYEGSAPVVWRGMMCLTGGAATSVQRTAALEFDNLDDGKFTDTVTCTADGTTWKLRTETMQAKRAFHSAASHGAKMCVSGGYNFGTSASTVTMLNSVECSTDGKTWSYLAPLSQARAYHTMFVFQGELCTVGGSKTHKYSMVSFPLECSSDGRNWKLYAPNQENEGLVHSGASTDPDGTFFVPKLTATGALDSLRSYSRFNGWTSIALRGEIEDNKGQYHMPATFTFTETGNFLEVSEDDYP